MKNLLLINIILLFYLPGSYAQSNEQYRNPVDGEILLAGTYGELRPNHFHTGIDIKTQSTGKNIYSIEKGYVSRINISPFGYGKAVYIDHPDGNTSVYAHLSTFSDKIEKYIRKKQYENNKYVINVLLDSTEIPVEKGEIIGLSGNSGLSFGPHLHFEIRNTISEIPINPLKFVKIHDNIPPKFKSLSVQFVNNNVIDNTNKLFIPLNNTTSKINDIQIHNDKVILGIEAFDKVNNSNNICGLYQIKMFVDSVLYCHIVFDSISFYKMHYINSFIDYYENSTKKLWIQRLYKSKNNNLNIYKAIINDGIIEFDSLNNNHKIKMIIEDFYKNTNELYFNIHYTPAGEQKKYQECDYNIKLSDSLEINLENVKINFPDSLFIEDNYCITINYDRLNKQSKYSGVLHLGNYTDIGLKKYSLSIKPEITENTIINKLLIAYINNNNKIISLGGHIVDDYLQVKTNKFGKYIVLCDTVPPNIKPVNIYDNADLRNKNQISFKITDNLSGIKEYKGYIDGKWVLFEYEPKNNTITYNFDNEIKKSDIAHNLLLLVTDDRENITTFIASFYY
ncbi:MAG: M23 family metallopeptidase [Marinilabiliales bacterium]